MAFPSELILLLTFFLSNSNIQAFYVPGVAPVEFEMNEKIEVKAVKMTSTQTQLPYEYYSLPFCKPEGGIVYKSENLGEVLRGDRIVNTPYDVRMGVNTPCRLLCNSPESPMIWQFDEQSLVSSRISHDYYVHLLVDNLPCATKRSDSWINFEHGYRLGFTMGSDTYIHNHLDLHFFYHQISDQNRYRVVGFQVNVQSVNIEETKFMSNGNEMVCSIPNDAKPQSTRSPDGGNLRLYFTYSVTWNASDISWASRWDSYLTMTDVEIHWFSIINSIVVVFVLSGLVALIIIRTLRRDIARYNADDMTDEMTEQSGWKLVHGDVFRPPKYPRLFAAVIGSGVQIFLMSLLTILFAMLGMLSPASRGALMTCAIFFYACMGAIAGYISARVYKTIKGRQWKKAAFLTAVFYPGIVFGTCFILNLFIWNKSSSGAVPFTTMLSLLLIWFGISVPLIFLGYYLGYKKPALQNPVRTNQIPRQVPEQMWYLHPYLSLLFSILMAGLLPFAAVFIELFFTFTAIWQNQFYYLFGFLFLVFVILVICCGLIAIVMIYFQLCNEDYHWWWRCLATSGGCAVYVFLYSIYYFITRLHITESVPMLLYFGYTGVMVLTFWLLTATIGFFSVYAFLRKIYSAIKID